MWKDKHITVKLFYNIYQVLVFNLLLLGRQRKLLEKLRPPSVNELLLSNDGDTILEGCLTNFFVVCCKVRKQIHGF